MRRAVPIALAAALLAGCGEERTQPPDLERPDSPTETEIVTLEGADVSFEAPVNWQPLPPAPPMEGGISSKTAIVAVWRYPRTEPLPANRKEYDAAEERLVARIEERSGTFSLRSSDLTRYDGARAIEVLGRQTIAGRPYDVRSTHVFDDGAELVLDAYAPPGEFARVDGEVFVPLLDSLSLG